MRLLEGTSSVILLIALLFKCSITEAGLIAPTNGTNRRVHLTSFVKGGSKVLSDTEFPYQVSIRDEGGFLLCSGSIVSHDWFVTAVHCGFDLTSNNSHLYTVRSGSLRSDVGGSLHNFTRKLDHEDFNRRTFANDISVWQVQPPFNLSTPVKIPPQGYKFENGSSFVVSGWGSVEMGHSESLDLLQALLFPSDVETCHNTSHGLANVICAGNVLEEKGACKGDSGGPLSYMSTKGEKVLVGVVSWGKPGYTCADTPSVYTEVAAFSDWITSKINQPINLFHP